MRSLVHRFAPAPRRRAARARVRTTWARGRALRGLFTCGALTACGASDATSADLMQLEFAGDAALMVASDSGRYSVALRSLPSELPVRGNNRVELTISSETAATADDLDVRIVPFMPAMGHGSGSEPWGRAMGGGVYEFEDVHITMPGRWELRTFITSDTTDHASVAFDVR